MTEARLLDRARAAVPDGGAEDRDVWNWMRPVLQWSSIILPFSIAMIAIFDGGQSLGARLAGLGLALAYGAWTWVTRNKVLEDEACAVQSWNVAYLLVAYALFGAMATLHPIFFFMLFLLFWRTYSLLPLRYGIPMGALLIAVSGLAQFLGSDHDHTDLSGLAISSAVSMVFSVLTALFIGRVIDQSKERAALIEQLQSTRSDLASVSREAGALAERERIAHEIHDTLAQGFTSIVMLAQAASAALETEPAAAARALGSIESTARDNLAEARNLVEDMLPAPLAEGSLPAALGRLAERTAVDLGIDAAFELRGVERPLSQAHEVALLRVAQEAVANARKHAQPRSLRIVLDYGPARAADRASGPGDAGTDGDGVGDDLIGDAGVELSVVDDGTGFDPGTAAEGVGLAGMRRRLAEAGGRLTVTSAPGAGTSIGVVLA